MLAVRRRTAVALCELLEDERVLPCLQTLGLGGNEVADKDIWLSATEVTNAVRPSLDLVWEPRA